MLYFSAFNHRRYMTFQNIFGSLAAITTTISFFPQALKVIRTRDTRSISLLMYLLFTFGVACWLVYGIMRGDLPIAAANTVTLILSLIILFFKLRENKR